MACLDVVPEVVAQLLEILQLPLVRGLQANNQHHITGRTVSPNTIVYWRIDCYLPCLHEAG